MSDLYLVRHCAPTQAGIKPEACSPVPMDTLLLSMYNNNAMSIMDTRCQLNNLAAELDGNMGETVGETEKATRGEDASRETIINLNPEYIFVLDRSTATGGVQVLYTMFSDLVATLLG